MRSSIRTAIALVLASLPVAPGPVGAALAQSDVPGLSPETPLLQIPFSVFASDEAKRAWAERNDGLKLYAEWKAALPPEQQRRRDADLLPSFLRQIGDTKILPPLVRKQQARYNVEITPRVIAGVYTELFTPAGGVDPANAERVLINLHGGGFWYGGKVGGRVESIPIASVGKIRVVSVDYRQAPEHLFPAASEDVALVYSELLKEYRPENIGIYGCSAGAMLTAQAVASFVDKQLPLPGAIGMFCGTGELFQRGDSAYFSAALDRSSVEGAEAPQAFLEYLRGADPDNPLLFPMRHPELLRRFPPSLFITGSRAFEMSGVITAHNELTAANVKSELHVWDGLMHAFLFDPDLPESREAYAIVGDFFHRNLGRPWYASEFEAFLTADLKDPPQPCDTLFVGSSSIRFWESLAKDMAPFPVRNRGFGGSTIADLTAHFDRVITPYRPSAILFYGGENDLVQGKSPQEILRAFEAFLTLKRRALGETPVHFISVKPSVARAGQRLAQSQLNNSVRRMARERNDLHFIDVASPMLASAKFEDFFVLDGLHLNAEGYALWTSLLRPVVAEITKTAGARCRARRPL